jgi:hypothetical protein
MGDRRNSLLPLRQPLLALALAGALLAGLGATTSADSPVTAARLLARRKALFIEQFTRLIEWPASALPKDGPFVLCLVASSETAAELTKLASIRKFKDRSVEVRALSPDANDGVAPCHVVYLASSAGPRLGKVLEAVAGKPVLTVSDTAGFIERGVQFNLFEESRPPDQAHFVNFEVNVQAVKRSVLAFDAQLLSQGRKVDVPPPPPPQRPREP